MNDAEKEISFGDICSARFSPILFDEIKDDAAASAIRSQFLNFQLDDLVGERQAKARNGMYSVVYKTNISPTAKLFKVLPPL